MYTAPTQTRITPVNGPGSFSTNPYAPQANYLPYVPQMRVSGNSATAEARGGAVRTELMPSYVQTFS